MNEHEVHRHESEPGHALPQGLAHVLSAEAMANYPHRKPNQPMLHRLQALTPADLFGARIPRSNQAPGLLSGLWLLHGFLEQSHEISQALATPEGSWWHAIMHRLEGDYWNSKYWYRQVGSHVIFSRLTARLKTAWAPDRFVDECKRASERSSNPATQAADQAAVQHVAQIEWQELFAYSWEQAGGEPTVRAFFEFTSNTPR
jgi:hypothetical protein